MNLIISSSPHLQAKETIPKVMWQVSLALLPAIFASIYFFRLDAIRVLLVSIITCILSEYLFLKIRRKKTQILNGSCILTGILFALILPPKIPNYAVVIGAFFAIVFGKQIFGGLGYNIFNPALIGRAFLMAAYPVLLTTWSPPVTSGIHSITCATPLGLYKFSHIITSIKDLFFGNVGGSLGETSALALIIGGLYLLIRKIADWRIPLSIITTILLISMITWLINPDKFASPLFHLFAGGLMLGAFFMATDPVTTPITKLGRFTFGIGVGSLVMLIRIRGGLPEGVMYSILIMNGFTPLINRITMPKRFGAKR
jgi:electron transport complex protein RnfD